MIRAIQAVNQLQRRRVRHKAILDVIPDLMLCMDRKGNLVEIKGGNSGSFLLDTHELSGRKMSEVMPQGVAEQVLNGIEEVLKGGGTQFFEYDLRLPAEIRYYEARIVACGEDEVLCIVRDISERKRMEEELLKAKKIEATGILAGGIAHDFNNILSIIMASLQVVQMDLDPESPNFKLLMNARKAALRARDLTQRFITFSMSEAPLKKPTRVEPLIKDCVHSVLEGSDIECRCIFPEGLRMIEADQGQMRQVFHNIILNARESMPCGGTILIEAENVKAGAGDTDASLKTGGYVGISFQDQGSGIPEKNIDKVFDPYFSTKERCSQKGMGLGLTVAYSVVRKHGGNICLESVPQVGTTVHVYVPAFVEERLSRRKTVP